MVNNTVAVAYIPVLHQGYFTYLKKLEGEGVSELYLVSDDVLQSHDELDYINRKDRLRAIPHDVMKRLLRTCTTIRIESLTINAISELKKEDTLFVAPDEDINRFIMETYFKDYPVTYHSVFLRWNRENLGEETEPNTPQISLSKFEKEVFTQIIAESTKSTDWWRQVGAALVKKGELIAVAHNEHIPEKELPNIIGDSRSLFKKGINIEYVTSAHAEVGIIGQAAKKGISTEGAELFVTDFPCPYCARLIAKSGIKKIYFMHGYAVLGGDAFFKDMGIEVVKVSLE